MFSKVMWKVIMYFLLDLLMSYERAFSKEHTLENAAVV